MQFDINKIREFGNVEFLAKQMVEGFVTGLHKSPFHGFSVEFAEHRLYNNGDSTRHIDWKVYGKTDKLFLKRYEEETNLRCHLLIDTSSSMYYPEKSKGKIVFSVLAAAAIANMLQRQKDAVGLCTFSDSIDIQTQVKSTPTHLHKLFLDFEGIMDATPKFQKTSVVESLHLIAEKIHKRSLVIIFSDMFDDIQEADKIFSALQHLKHNRHEVLLFHVKDKATEEDFAFEERPYEFVDIETGDKIKAQPSQVRDYYQQSIKSFFAELKLKCGQYKIDFIEADINDGIDKILWSYVIKRDKMR